ncbi:MAG: sulfatase, partial [Rhodopirellula sp. JB044]|uniref:sulfatase family protein n=1 Tax=Rhodopirellula sp. JB044 TaxID=3342844 RepID=UPI00370A98EB
MKTGLGRQHPTFRDTVHASLFSLDESSGCRQDMSVARPFTPLAPPMFLPRYLCLCRLSVLAIAFVTLFSAAVYADRPNVLVIITDDQGWADIGYNNPQKAYTPNLDRLAAEGARLANHYVMPQCTPTRVACFTGRYPGRFGRTPLEATNDRCFPVGTPTLANMMKSVGYQTYLIGKWHMG